MRWGRIALYFLVAVVAILAITVSLAFTVDLGRFKSDAEIVVSDLLNRELTIRGPLHLSLGRSIELSAEDVHLAGTDWSADSNIVSVREIRARVNTWSLISGPIMIESLVVDGVRISLEHNAAGENNWTFLAPEEDPASEEVSGERPRMPVLADNVRISDLVLIYDNPNRRRPFEFSASLIEENINDAEIHLALTGDINATPVALNVSAGRVEDLIEFGKVDLALTGNLGEIELRGEAHVADLIHPGTPTIRLSIEGPNVEYLTDRLRLERITTGPLSLEIIVSPTQLNQHLTVQGDIGEFKVIANGQFVDLRRLDEMELNLSASGPNASTLGDLLGAKNVPPDPFSIVGKFRRSGSNITIERITVTVGDTQFDMQASFMDFPNSSGANGTVRLSGPDIGRFSKLIGVPGRLKGPFKLDADLVALDGGGATVDVTAETSDQVLHIKGNIVDTEKFVGTDVQVHYTGPALSSLTDALGLESGPDEPFSLDAGIVRIDDGFIIDAGNLSVGGHRLSFNGVLGDKPLERGTDIHFDLAGPNFAGLLDAFGRDADELPYTQYRLSGRIERIPEHFVLHDVVAEIGAGLEYELSVDGIVSDQPRLLGSRVRVGARGNSIGAITDAAGIKGIPDEPFDIAATIEIVEKGYSIDQGRARVGDGSAIVSGLVGIEPLSRHTNLEFEVTSPSLKSTLAKFNVDVPLLPEGELIASGAIRSRGRIFELQKVTVTFAGATANIQGKLGELPSFDGADLKLDISGSDLSSLLPPIDAVKGMIKPFSLSANVRLRDNELELKAVRIRVDETRFALDASLGLDPFLEHGEFTVNWDSPDVLVLYPQAAEITVPDTAPLELHASGNWAGNLWAFDRFDLRLGAGRITIDGVIDGPPNFDKTDLRFDWQISSLDRFDILAGRDLPDLPAHLTFHVVGTSDVMTVRDFDALVGESDINGEFLLRDGDVLDVEISVFSESLDLTPFLPREPEGPTEPPAPQPVDKNRKLIPDRPVSGDFLYDFSAKVNIRVDEIKMQERTMSDVTLVGDLTGGHLTISEFTATSSRDGEFSGKMSIQPKNDGIEMGLRLFGDGLIFGFPADTQEELDQLPTYAMDLAFVTEGNSLRELAGAVNGYLRMVGGEGRIRAGDLTAFTNDFLSEVFNTVNPFASKDPYSNLECIAVLATFEDGQVIGRPMLVVQSERLKIVANTEIDLKTERLEVNFNTVPQKGLGISLTNLVNPYVKVAGTLGNPSLTLNTESALIQGGAAVATAGLSILAKGLADRFLASKDPCGDAISDADEQFELLLEKYGSSGATLQP